MGGNTAAAAPDPGAAQRSHSRALDRLGALALRAALSLVLAIVLLAPWPGTQVWAWSLPSLTRPQPSQGSAGPPLSPTAPAGRLQESAPPAAVQQLQQELGEHLPQVEILSPRDGAVLPDGAWLLRARVHDWPLADAGDLGLGAHLMVQIDDQPAQPLLGPADGLELELPALAPGSHRITVYAAKPWGEAVKSPGAIRQVRIHRVAANPLGLPAQGSPQLLPVSPAAGAQFEPVLLDWILLDAPLQNLRPGDGSWRLRVSINGDSFLLDQNVPLWLRGWKPGVNSLLLELVDGLGEPLNPPFNSLVQEVLLPSGPGAGTTSRPRWLGGRLSDQELDLLLGRFTPLESDPQPSADAEPIPAEPATKRSQTASPDPETGAGGGAGAGAGVEVEVAVEDAVEASAPEEAATAAGTPDGAEPDRVASGAEASIRSNSPAPSEASEPERSTEPLAAEQSLGQDNSAEAVPQSPTGERITSSTGLSGTAREQVNPDGSLIQPRTAGPLAGLRQRLNP